MAVTHASTDVLTGGFPGVGSPCGSNPVKVLDDTKLDGEDEGRAMLQIVHDVAPGASLSFASASAGHFPAFAANIKALANAGATVIVDDVGYSAEPFFQDSPGRAGGERSHRKRHPLSLRGRQRQQRVRHRAQRQLLEAPFFRDIGVCPDSVVALSEEIEEEEEDDEHTEPDRAQSEPLRGLRGGFRRQR